MSDKEIPDPPPPSSLETNHDDMALEETKAIEFDTYIDQDKRRREHIRAEKIKDAFAISLQWGIYLVAVLLVTGVLVWAWHLLTPNEPPYDWHWLSKDQLYEVQKVMTGSLLALVLSELTHKHLK